MTDPLVEAQVYLSMHVTVLARTTPSSLSPSLPRMDYREAFLHEWPDDRHFLPYWIEGDPQSMRVKKANLGKSGTLLFQLLVLDVDQKNNDTPVEPPRDPAWGWYRTKHGFRFFAELETPIGPEHFESAIQWALGYWKSRGVTADKHCSDWTHIYRLPRVVRDGVAQSTDIVFPTASLPCPPFTPKAPKPTIPPLDGSLKYLDKAKEWALVDAPLAVEGDGADNTTFRVADNLVHGFSLERPGALALMAEWNQRNPNPWPHERLVYKLDQAIEHGTTPPGSAVFTLAAAEQPKPKKEKKPKAPKQEKDERYDLGDLQLAEILGAELSRVHGPISSLNGALYQLRDGEWLTFSEHDYLTWATGWDGKSPNPDVYKPIKLTFGKHKGLRETLAVHFDVYNEIRALTNILFYTKQGAVTLEGITPYTPTIGVQVLERDWHSQDDCPKFQAFMDQILSREDQEFIRNFIGLCLLGRGSEIQTALCFEGVGANGKSVLLLIISRLFPNIYKTCVPPKLMNDATKLWPFRTAKINIVSDLSLRHLDDPAGLKQVVAGDEVMARRLYEDHTTIRPIAGHIFSSNMPPRADDVSQAFLRRWLIIYFSRRIPENMQVQGLDKLLWDEESVGICKWFMLGAANVAANGLEVPSHLRQEMKDWSKDQDPVRRVVTELTAGVERFTSGDMLDKVNVMLLRESMDRVSSVKVAEFYRSLGYVSQHTAKGTTWEKRQLKLVTG